MSEVFLCFVKISIVLLGFLGEEMGFELGDVIVCING